eukprot:6189296-Prymnesium_polylepis.1
MRHGRARDGCIRLNNVCYASRATRLVLSARLLLLLPLPSLQPSRRQNQPSARLHPLPSCLRGSRAQVKTVRVARLRAGKCLREQGRPPARRYAPPSPSSMCVCPSRRPPPARTAALIGSPSFLPILGKKSVSEISHKFQPPGWVSRNSLPSHP